MPYSNYYENLRARVDWEKFAEENRQLERRMGGIIDSTYPLSQGSVGLVRGKIVR